MLSVIIPTRNRCKLLQNQLESLAAQTLPFEEFEVIVVDNGSSDNTTGIVKKFTHRLVNLRYFQEFEPGLHAGRHRGLKEAKGEILVYTDDDIRASPTWLEAISENFSSSEVVLVGGNNYPDFQDEVPGWLEKLWSRPSMGGQGIGYLSVLSLPEGRHEIDPLLVWGCNFSIRKQVLLEAGGFHPDGFPKELIRFRGDGESYVSRYVLENKLRCIFDSRASVYHAVTPERMTFEYFRQRAFNEGVSSSYALLRYKKRSRSIYLYSRALTRYILNRINQLQKVTKVNDQEISRLFLVMREGHQEGFEYHQRMYREDPEVRTWVHKKNYF